MVIYQISEDSICDARVTAFGKSWKDEEGNIAYWLDSIKLPEDTQGIIFFLLQKGQPLDEGTTHFMCLNEEDFYKKYKPLEIKDAESKSEFFELKEV